jgi:MFS family permease
MNIHPKASGFVIAAGAILGICAGLLWTAQGSLMLSYPTEIQKGRFISIFWSIFNLGGVIGASVSLGLNFKSNVSYCGSVRNERLMLGKRPTLVSNCCLLLKKE